MPDRRSVLLRLATAAGVAAPAMAALRGEAMAATDAEATDIAIFQASVALEHHAIALYTKGLRQKLFPAEWTHYAIEFKGDHQGHRDTENAVIAERGGREVAPLEAYELGHLEAGPVMLQRVLEIEQAAQDAYLALLSSFRGPESLQTAASVLIDEVRHLTIWKRALGLRIY